jgi:hypothetical protein
MALINAAQETNMNDVLSRRALVLVLMAFLAWAAWPGLVQAGCSALWIVAAA